MEKEPSLFIAINPPRKIECCSWQDGCSEGEHSGSLDLPGASNCSTASDSSDKNQPLSSNDPKTSQTEHHKKRHEQHT